MAKKVLVVFLMGFVGLSIAWMIFQDVGDKVSANKESALPSGVSSAGRVVVAYYFYGNVRCPTCHKLETYTGDVITNSLAANVSGGELAFVTINMDEKDNSHFVTDYELAFKSVVLSDVVDGKQVRWKNLDKIWDLVGDKAEFQDYIRKETVAYLEDN